MECDTFERKYRKNKEIQQGYIGKNCTAKSFRLLRYFDDILSASMSSLQEEKDINLIQAFSQRLAKVVLKMPVVAENLKEYLRKEQYSKQEQEQN